MPVKIRLSRQGKKGHPYFHIVVADARAPRDGKYIERLGFYNPNTDPATIEVDVDGAVKWLENGAQPTDTARAILSYKGVLYKNHLMKGVKKGAFDEAEAEKRFEAWTKEKQDKIENKVSNLASAGTKAAADRMQAEVEKNKARAAAIAAANAPAPVEEEAPEATETPEAVADTPSEEAKEIVAKEPEVTVAEAEETVAEVKEEAPAKEEKVEEPKAEETPATEDKAEEPKAEAKEEATAEKEEEEKK